jgi:hypothetical protein
MKTRIAIIILLFLAASTSGQNALFRALLSSKKKATVIYSIRKVNLKYNGPAMRIRHGVSNMEQDVAFASNFLDTAGLKAFLSGSVGYVVRWYDQSGNNFHLSQPLAGSQPQIQLNQFGKKPAVVSDGINDYMTVAFPTAKNQPYTQAAVVNITGGTGDMFAVSHRYQSGTVGLIRAGGQTRVANHGYTYVYTWPMSTNQLLISVRNNSAGTGSLRRNGVNVTPAATVANESQVGSITFFAELNSTGTVYGNYGAVKMAEYILWTTWDLTSKRDSIQNSINTFYQIY